MKKITEFVKKNKVLSIVLVVSLAALVILLCVLNTDNKRLQRALKKADATYSEGAYMLAGKKYEKALKIKGDCVDAFKGMVLSYVKSDNADAKEKAREAYDKAMTAFSKLSTDDFNANTGSIAEVAVLVNDIYGEEEGSLEKYEEAYKLSMHNREVGAMLSKEYIKKASELTTTEEYEESMALLDKAYEMNPTSEELVAVLEKTVPMCAIKRAKRYEFDSAFEVLDKYKGIIVNVDLNPTAEEVKERKKLYEAKNELLKAVYDALLPYYTLVEEDYLKNNSLIKDEMTTRAYTENLSAIMALDGSEKAEILSQSLSEGSYKYSESGFDENFSGIGAALYPYGNIWENEDGNTRIAYYFFIGSYNKGVRDGLGVSFMRTGESTYEIFEGMWADDNPNGEGVMYICGNDYKRATFGNWKDGYANGTMTEVIRTSKYDGEIFKGDYTASEGVPSEASAKTDEYEIVFDDKDCILIDVLPSTSAGYELYVTSTWSEGTKIGAIGYR